MNNTIGKRMTAKMNLIIIKRLVLIILKLLKDLLLNLVVYRGVEPLFEEWKSSVLTDRRIDHLPTILIPLSQCLFLVGLSTLKQMKATILILRLSLVELPGFEPRITEPKSAVLPLHHSSILVFIIVAVGLPTLALT